jgi:hypothetical protein
VKSAVFGDPLALDCCDREAMSFLATTGGISGNEVRDLMVAAVEYASAGSIACRLPSNGCLTTVAATSLATRAENYTHGDRSAAAQFHQNHSLERLNHPFRSTPWKGDLVIIV